MTATATLAPSPSRVMPWSRLGDEMLAGRAAAGNGAAFTALYQRYYGPLLGYTRSILLDAEDARDATQNALESALRALPEREPGRPLRPWLYKIAHNEAIDIIRRRRPQSELTQAFEPIVPGPEVDAEQRGRLAELVDDLRTLPERQRGALVMRELNGLSYDDIGLALGLSNEAARRAVFDARNALHDALDGRATACDSVRHSISDGDRRSLRARGIRAHLRSCDDCASFQRSIGARRADLHMIAPWLSGAAVMGALGAGGAGGGGALLATGGGASAAAGGPISWTALPLAAKALAVAAAVATTGTAAVAVRHAADPARHAGGAALAAGPGSARADAQALHAAALAARSATRLRTPATATRGHADRVRVSAGTSTSGAGAARSTATSTARRDVPPLAAPVVAPAPSASSMAHDSTSQTKPATVPAVVKSPVEKAIAKLQPLRDQIQQAFADAAALAGGGTPSALAQATGLLDSTLGPLETAIDRVLAPLGLKLPAYAPAASSSSPSTTSAVLAPVQQVLGGVQGLLQKLLGSR
ncbi:MAG TPA: sigma-70 family RNA polymerase sigma factor [Solirubrobacteraceae bacterium]